MAHKLSSRRGRPSKGGHLSDRSTFGGQVQRLRQSLKLSQSQFAERFGLDCSTLKNWEQDRSEPEKAVRTFLELISLDPENISALVQRSNLEGHAFARS